VIRQKLCLFFRNASIFLHRTNRKLIEISFISDRDPTPNITRNVTWQTYNHYNFTYLEINWHSYIWFRYRQSHYGFWNEYFPRMASQDYCENLSIRSHTYVLKKLEYRTKVWTIEGWIMNHLNLICYEYMLPTIAYLQSHIQYQWWLMFASHRMNHPTSNV